jgi:hypothetical protein
MPNEATLSQRMRQLSWMPKGQSRAAELNELANKLEAAVTLAYSDNGTKDDVKRMLGAWARARRLWCDVTGEPLI